MMGRIKPIIILVGGFNPSEKYESQLGLLFSIYGKIKNVPNHQPVSLMFCGSFNPQGDSEIANWDHDQ